jgi:hypothetical protein
MFVNYSILNACVKTTEMFMSKELTTSGHGDNWSLAIVV